MLKGEICSGGGACGARGVSDAFESWNDRVAGFAGILGFAGRLTGGGGLAPFDPTDDDSPGESPDLRSGGTGGALTGVVGRLDDTFPDERCRDSRDAFAGLREERKSSPRSPGEPNPRGGD